MEIAEEMVNVLKFPREIVELALAPFMEMPTGEHPFVMQHHWRGHSVHVDWRMKQDGYLNGWTVLDNPIGTPKVETIEEAERALKSVPFRFKFANLNMGRRAEAKARQPTDWLKVHGVTKPGEVGATRENEGVLYIFEKGVWTSGVQKPYFHEYFIKSDKGTFFPKGEWVRIVIRAIGVPALDPETKKPLQKRELLWRVLIPSTQEPYAISDRAMKRGYKPPQSNPTPFPIEWAKKNFAEQYKKWDEWKSGKTMEKKCKTCFNFKECTNPETLANPDREGCDNWAPQDLVRAFESLPFASYKNFADCVKKNADKKNPDAYCAFIARQTGEIASLSPGRFVLHFNSWMGQFVVRGVPKREWYLRYEDDKGVRSFFFEQDPLYYQPTSANDEGHVDKKWLSFEGKIPPRTKYNPNKKIPAIMKIVDSGSVSAISETEDGTEIVNLKFSGKKLKGKWRLVQEEKQAPTYNFEKLSAELASLTFALQKHWIPKKEAKSPKYPEDFVSHWDLRLSNGTEFNLYSDPVSSSGEIEARRKTFSAEKIKPWMDIDKEHKFMMVGPLSTYVDPLDKGDAEIFEMTPDFMSMKLHGKSLHGYFVWKKGEAGQVFVRSRLPPTKETKSETMSMETDDNLLDRVYEKVLKQIDEKANFDLEKEKTTLELKKKKIELINQWLEANKEK